jgi:hypothetical protein
VTEKALQSNAMPVMIVEPRIEPEHPRKDKTRQEKKRTPAHATTRHFAPHDPQ